MPQKAQQIKIYIYLRPSHSTEIHQYLMSIVPIARTNNHALMHQRHAPCIFISYYFVHSDLIILVPHPLLLCWYIHLCLLEA